ncbi:MAG: hypothetical protein ACJA08_000512 [Cyclobacteriaceae bacterium]|jgi:hypothetical protein
MKHLFYSFLQLKSSKQIQKTIMVFVLTLLCGSTFAQTISIQGVLRDPNGRSVDDGSYSVTFKIYDAATGGSTLWTDTYTSLQTKHGVFQANLGEQTSLDGLGFDTQYFVGVTVEAYAEMTPRIALTIYPYAKAILGQDNKFPSVGNVEMATDDFIIHEGELRLAGAGGRILFNDGTSLNTANFGGPAGSLLNSSNVNINADNIADFSGAINFQTRGTTRASIANNGNATFNGSINAAFGISSGTYNTSIGSINLYGPDAASASGGQLNLYTSDTRATEKWYMQPVENNLILGHETGGAFPTVATFSSAGTTLAGTTVIDALTVSSSTTLSGTTVTDALTVSSGTLTVSSGSVAVGSNFSVSDNVISAGTSNTTKGILQLYGSNGATGGQANFYTNAGQAVSKWFLETNENDFAIGHENAGSFPISAYFDSSGSIGIGDDTPTEGRLVVKGLGVGGTVSLLSYLEGAGAGNTPIPSFSSAFGIYADGGVVSEAGFYVISDKRVKEIQRRTNTSEDLDVFSKLNVTDYEFIDKVQHGDKKEKKLIAQEVRAVYPQAVSLSKGIVPDIYAKSINTSFKEDSNLLTIRLEKIHGLIEGDVVKIFLESGEKEVEVLSIVNDHTFSIQSDISIENIFVYGKQVKDFHTIDYDAIAMLNVSATQELAKQVAALQKENEALKKKLEKIDLLEAKLNALLDPADASSYVQVVKE